ncbi:hypothetical protein [Lutibacter sp.]
MEFKLIISIILLIIGLIFTFLNEQIIELQGSSKNGDPWEISNDERKMRMKIGGFFFILYGSLYIAYWLIKKLL